MSFVQTILERCAQRGPRPVLHEVHEDGLVATSGDALLDSVARARAFLRGRRVQPGDRVALLAPNSARWAAMDLAILAEGAICVPLYARQDPVQLAGMLRDCQPVLLIADGDALASSIGTAWGEASKIATYNEVLATEPSAREAALPDEGRALTLIYTSGTSGEPKGVMLGNHNVEHMLGVTVRELAKMSKSGRAEDRVFHYLPFCFAGSRIMLWSQLHRGNPLLLSVDLARLQQELAVAAPHYCLNVPALLERIRAGVTGRILSMPGAGGRALATVYAHATRAATNPSSATGLERAALAVARKALFPRIKQMIGENLEFLACGSAPLSEETQRWFQAMGIPVYQVYGLTETTAIVTIDDTSHVVPGYVGRAIAGCDLKLSDEGELLTRGPNVFLGYWNRAEATAEMLRDGWLHTGDLAELDAAGNVKILGRVKDVLVPESGHNVAPLPIEQRILEAVSGIEHAVVIGHGRPFLTALISGAASDGEIDRAINAVNTGLPHYQRIRKHHHTSEPFTIENGMLTANQKLKRKAIEQRYTDAIERMYR
jgi:long-chain acyl-CoA synthetase